MDATATAEALLSYSKVGQNIAVLIESDLDALGNTAGVPTALVNRLKRSMEAAALLAEKVSETGKQVGGRSFEYTQGRLEASEKQAVRRLALRVPWTLRPQPGGVGGGGNP